MHLDRYEYFSKTKFDYEFVSTGPRGRIKKVVRFQRYGGEDGSYYNLEFGDLNERNGRLDDLAVSGNGDRDKVLATIAAIIVEFTRKLPRALIHAKGSTGARTRLYQMGICANLPEIESKFWILGLEANKGWEHFCKNVNYIAFLIKNKLYGKLRVHTELHGR